MSTPKESFEFDSESKALVIDDEKSAKFLHTNRLRSKGVSKNNIIIASDGAEALEMLAKDNKKEIKLVILDLNMPKINGFVVFEEISRSRSDIRVIIATCRAMTDDEIAQLDGAHEIISKPIRASHMDGIFETSEEAQID